MHQTPLRASLLKDNPLEGDLLALEAAAATAAATSTEPAAATTAVTESTTATATAATAAEAAAAATATTATAEATAATVVVAGLGIVKADLATLNVLAVQLLESLLGVIDRCEGNVAETLGATRLTEKTVSIYALKGDRSIQGKDSRVGRKTEALNFGGTVEEVGDDGLVGVEGQVADEESVAGRADLVAVLLLALGGTLAGVGVLLLAGKVDAHVAAVQEGARLLGVGLLGDLLAVEVDVAEAARPAGLLVRDDASADETLVAGELLVQGVVVNVPRQVADPQSGRGLAVVSLGLLGRSVGLLDFVLSLALVGRSLGLGLLLLLGAVIVG